MICLLLHKIDLLSSHFGTRLLINKNYSIELNHMLKNHFLKLYEVNLEEKFDPNDFASAPENAYELMQISWKST